MKEVTFSEVRAAFHNDSVYGATEDQLRNYLKALSGSAILNDAIKHQVGVMAQTISQIQVSRMITRSNKQNIAFTAIAIALSLGQLIFAVLALTR